MPTPEAETILFYERARLNKNVDNLSTIVPSIRIGALLSIVQDANSIAALAKELLRDELNETE